MNMMSTTIESVWINEPHFLSIAISAIEKLSFDFLSHSFSVFLSFHAVWIVLLPILFGVVALCIQCRHILIANLLNLQNQKILCFGTVVDIIARLIIIRQFLPIIRGCHRQIDIEYTLICIIYLAHMPIAICHSLVTSCDYSILIWITQTQFEICMELLRNRRWKLQERHEIH